MIPRKHQTKFNSFLIVSIAAFILIMNITANDHDNGVVGPGWTLHVINADSRFEAAGVGDIDGDGLLDIVCGDFWYQAPNWTPHRIAEQEELNEYYNDFAAEVFDIDGDGDNDILSCAWFSRQIFWRENPGPDAEGLWPVHVVDEPGNMETGFGFDVDGDGVDDFVPNLMSEVAWYQMVGPAQWEKREVGDEGAGHGLGLGDLNNDGVTDIITPHGWYEGRRSDEGMDWIWHPEFQLGSASVPVVAYDVNGDGLTDIVWGMAHDYGIYWLEQGEEEGERTWTRRVVDESWSQAHYFELADLDGDGVMNVVTGKRYRAHNGGDPGWDDPLCIFAYHYDAENGEWVRKTISEGGRVGFGLNPTIADIDGDGKLDIIAPGKSGLYLLTQK